MSSSSKNINPNSKFEFKNNENLSNTNKKTNPPLKDNFSSTTNINIYAYKNGMPNHDKNNEYEKSQKYRINNLCK